VLSQSLFVLRRQPERHDFVVLKDLEDIYPLFVANGVNRSNIEIVWGTIKPTPAVAILPWSRLQLAMHIYLANQGMEYETGLLRIFHLLDHERSVFSSSVILWHPSNLTHPIILFFTVSRFDRYQ
jgi:hypothetical protein